MMTKTKLSFIPGKLWKTFSNFVRKQVRITHWNVLYSLNSLGHIFTIPYQIIVHICIIYNPKIILGSSWTLARPFQQRRRLAIKLQTSLSESDRILKMAHPHHFWLRFVFLISSFVTSMAKKCVELEFQMNLSVFLFNVCIWVGYALKQCILC